MAEIDRKTARAATASKPCSIGFGKPGDESSGRCTGGVSATQPFQPHAHLAIVQRLDHAFSWCWRKQAGWPFGVLSQSPST